MYGYVCRLLISVPAPWAGHCNAETASAVHLGATCFDTLLLLSQQSSQSRDSYLPSIPSSSELHSIVPGTEIPVTAPVRATRRGMNDTDASTRVAGAAAAFDAMIQRYDLSSHRSTRRHGHFTDSSITSTATSTATATATATATSSSSTTSATTTSTHAVDSSTPRAVYKGDGDWHAEYRQLSAWSACGSRRIPAFVINLDRRPDR